eukprot:1912972-Amphidinium_carterae.1
MSKSQFLGLASLRSGTSFAFSFMHQWLVEVVAPVSVEECPDSDLMSAVWKAFGPNDLAFQSGFEIVSSVDVVGSKHCTGIEDAV